MTPGQASGPNFVTDWPVQGPTDEGIRQADCDFADRVLPKTPACVDCEGPVPPWANHKRPGLGEPLMESISYGGRVARGYALGAAGDPDVFDGLNAAQQIWVRDALVKLNDYIVQTSKTTCPTWADPRLNPMGAAVGCFQIWFNANLSKATSSTLRTDGVFDEDTLCALKAVTGVYHAPDFTQAFPDPLNAHPCGPKPPAPVEAKAEGLSTGAMVGLGVGAAAVVGGVAYAATRKSGRRTRRRR